MCKCYAESFLAKGIYGIMMDNICVIDKQKYFKLFFITNMKTIIY